MPKWEVILELTFRVNNSSASIIKTNAKPELVKGILESWIMDQIGLDEDQRQPEIKERYHISIRLDLRDNTFVTTSDTGNTALTTGIIVNILRKLEVISIEFL